MTELQNFHDGLSPLDCLQMGQWDQCLDLSFNHDDNPFLREDSIAPVFQL